MPTNVIPRSPFATSPIASVRIRSVRIFACVSQDTLEMEKSAVVRILNVELIQ